MAEAPRLTPHLLLKAYEAGIFPMGEKRGAAEIFWVDPRFRGIFPLDNFHISRSLAAKIAQDPFTIRINTAFPAVLEACADRPETWINATLVDLYLQLHAQGHAHCLEVWEGAQLVGGVYGIALGAAFFGESMFSRKTDASKIALAYLIDRLTIGGFQLFDTQFLTPHLESLGAIEIPRDDYRRRLKRAAGQQADFLRQLEAPSGAAILQRNSQTS